MRKKKIQSFPQEIFLIKTLQILVLIKIAPKENQMIIPF
jgi:hypothetical protein